MQPRPKSIANEIADQRSLLWQNMTQTHHVDEVAIKRLQNRISALLKNEDIDSITRAMFNHELSYLYTYQGKMDDAMRHFDRTQGVLPENAMHLSKGHLLWMSGDLLRSREALEAIDLGQGDDQLFRTLVGCCTSVGMISQAGECLKRTSIKGRLEDHFIEASVKIITDLGVDDWEVTARLQTASNIIRKATSHPFMAYDIFADGDEGIFFQFIVDGSAQELVALDHKVVEALVDNHSGELDSMLSIGIKPFEPSEFDVSYGPYHASV